MGSYRQDHRSEHARGPDADAPRGPKTPMYHFQGNDNAGHHQPRPRRDFSFRHPKTSDRPLLMSKRELTPEPFGPEKDIGDGAVKFRETENVTDSDEADMDVSDLEGEPRRKKARTSDAPDVKADAAPKWSNPDPYSVLPPSDDPSRKRTDVVKLIRKARVASTQALAESSNAVTANDDFISFGFEAGIAVNDVPEGAPTGPRNNRQADSDSALGNRKRTHDDEIKGTARVKVVTRRGKAFNSDGSILHEWRPINQATATPWFRFNPLGDDDVGYPAAALHKEALDFYHWARPQSFEHKIRTDLITRLEASLSRKYPGCRLRPFGSFAAGLYLPVADMDLVLLSPRFLSSGDKTLCLEKKDVYKCTGIIRSSGLAVDGSVLPIPKAKVPIIKFVDKFTGLRVDLSFDNDSGIIANDTFQAWKEKFPVMPILVSVIKQFLLLRGLNDVATGGLGGFSIICLVTSMLQHLPPDAGVSNIGSLLMEFLNLYGNQFDTTKQGIRLNPPGYFDKRSMSIPYNKNKPERLCIIDPNRSDNDISGGTQEIVLILKTFSQAFSTLQDRLGQLARGRRFENGLLGGVLAGDYQPYQQQREQLMRIYESKYGRTEGISELTLPRPPPPPPRDEPPPPPPPSRRSPQHSKAIQPKPKSFQAQHPADSDVTLDNLARKYEAKHPHLNIHQLYSIMLQDLRPDVNNIPQAMFDFEAARFGGYADDAEMLRDLWARAKTKGRLGLSGQRRPQGQKTMNDVKAEMDGASKGQIRAATLRELRPDIARIPDSLNAEKAAKIGGYKNSDDMHHDFQRISNEREQLQTHRRK